jgi:hypothetical protein
VLTPVKKPTYRDLLDCEKTFNTQINKIRYVIEQIIANFKGSSILTGQPEVGPVRRA